LPNATERREQTNSRGSEKQAHPRERGLTPGQDWHETTTHDSGNLYARDACEQAHTLAGTREPGQARPRADTPASGGGKQPNPLDDDKPATRENGT